MTPSPKEKAEELVLRYLRIDNNTKEWFNSHIAKQCALIAVDEILNILEFSLDFRMDKSIKYWQQVKEELLNL
jgi:hypothetical protein